MHAILAAMLTLAVLTGEARAYVSLSNWLETPGRNDRHVEDEAFGDEFAPPPH